MDFLDFLIASLCFTAVVTFSSLMATGFYAACQFDGDEEFDKADKFIQKQWPKPNGEQAMIFWFVRYYLGKVIPYFWTKPLYSCIICMGSVHSLLPTFIFCHLTGTTFWIWPMVALATVGLNKHVSVWWSK